MFNLRINQIKEYLKVFVCTTHHIAIIPKVTHECTIDEENWDCMQCNSLADVNSEISKHNKQIHFNMVHLYMVQCIEEYFEKKIELNAIFDVLVNYVNMNDLLYLAFVAFKYRCKNLADILNVKQLYHTEMHMITLAYNNGNITYHHQLELISCKILRVLVGIFNYGCINEGHVQAINFGLSSDCKVQLSAVITKMFQNPYLASYFETYFKAHLKTFEYDELYQNYLKFGLNLRDTQLFERLGF